jgi:hypothetical protein
MSRFGSWSLLVLAAFPGLGFAQNPMHHTVTRVAEADEDYGFQGEYTGTLCGHGTVGLQVVAKGQGRFTGLLYPGGLPGNGYYGATKQALTGSREGDAVILTGENLHVRLQTGRAVIVTQPTGGLLGYLQPLHRYSLTQGAPPPAGARLLFQGSQPSGLVDAKVSADGFLQIGTLTAEPVGDFQLHAEFKTPYMPTAESQQRGNSGFYIQQRYEVQVLDSFGQEPAFNEAASLYRFKAPDLNMSFPPLVWQTYDIHFTAPRFDAQGAKIAKARITVRHNGVVVQNDVALENKTGGGKPEGPELLPLLLQNHGNPVEFRNLWLLDLPATTTYAAAATVTCPPPKWGRRARR